MSDWALVADIGGTNARFALTDLDRPAAALHDIRTLRGADFPGLQQACEHYLAEAGVRPRRAAIAVASPVDSDEIRLTNRAWSFGRHELERALGLERLRVINDFGAIARAVPALQPADLVHLQGEAVLPSRGPISVIGPGTGLGVALLVGDARRGWQVIATEGGHAGFAPVDDTDHAIARRLQALHGRTSNERLLSGAGLSRIDAMHRQADDAQLREPADIVRLALDGDDDHARRALAHFCAILGSVCGDVALMHGARSLVIAGGIVPRFIPFLRASAFHERFLAKGRFAGYLEPVAVHVVIHPHPGLLGAAVALHSQEETAP
jgi:glucokinase